MSEKHGENIYALDKHGKIVYVLDVSNGMNNYSCMGCGQEVVGCHRTNAAHKPYFRHHVTDLDKPSNCTYKDKSYRYKLAKEILQRIKQIKVPGLRKNQPHGIEGDPMIISRSKIITTKKVLVERQFYEGGIKTCSISVIKPI